MARLTSASEGANTESYTYDYLDNRKTRTSNGTTLAYVYDAANQLTEIRSGSEAGAILATLNYDANGDLTSKTGASPLALTWNAERELQAANNESYEYDDEGRRIRKTIAGTTINYLYNGPDIHAELNSANQVQAVYAHGPSWDDPLMRLTGQTNQPAANASYYHQDGLNSSVATTDSLGTTQGTQRFDAWGNKTASTGTIATFGYTGREPDATGLYYYRARYYDPSTGRFISKDPAGMPDGVNRYAYVKNDPVDHVDPTGLLASAFFFTDPNKNYTGGLSQGLTSSSQNLGRVTVTQLDDAAYSRTGVAGLFPDGAPIVTIGEAFGGLAAYTVGKATGNEALANAALDGLSQTRQSNVDTFLMLSTMGRGGAKVGPKTGEFSITDWSGYPASIPKPTGPFRLLEGAEYDAARNAANQANRAMHKADPSLAGQQIHEIQPVKFNGSPTDSANKVPLAPAEHAPVTNWWNQLQRNILGR